MKNRPAKEIPDASGYKAEFFGSKNCVGVTPYTERYARTWMKSSISFTQTCSLVFSPSLTADDMPFRNVNFNVRTKVKNVVAYKVI
jgi:hypothetical protein